MGFLLNGVNTEGLPIDLVKKLIGHKEIKYFVETGTAGGASVFFASNIFKKCYTIELIDERVRNMIFPDNVKSYGGVSSIDMLPNIIDDICIEENSKKEYILFWLDAHYSDSVPNETDIKECPVMEELNIISKYQNSIIIIDDARLFLGSPPYPLDPRDWPSISEIFVYLNDKFPQHYSTIIDDYVVSVPLEFKATIDEEWRERFELRYPSTMDKLKTQAKDVYEGFLKFINK